MTAKNLIECIAKDLYNPGELLNEVNDLSRPEISAFMGEIKKLVHHKDTTVGLWATDVFKDEYNSEDSIMFQIEY